MNLHRFLAPMMSNDMKIHLGCYTAGEMLCLLTLTFNAHISQEDVHQGLVDNAETLDSGCVLLAETAFQCTSHRILITIYVGTILYVQFHRVLWQE